jgi:hypothetical protein
MAYRPFTSFIGWNIWFAYVHFSVLRSQRIPAVQAASHGGIHGGGVDTF